MYQKVKIYSNTLIKFLKAKEKYDDINDQMVQSMVASKAIEPPPSPKRRKRQKKMIRAKKIRVKKLKKEDSYDEFEDAEESPINKLIQKLPSHITIRSPHKKELKFEDIKEFDPLDQTNIQFKPYESTSYAKITPDRNVQFTESS